MKIILTILLVLIIGVGGLYFTRNYLVEVAVEKSSSAALGVETELGSAQLDLTGGSLELHNFEVSNPKGYKADNFLVMELFVLDVNEGSLLDDEVIVDSFVIYGINLNFEQINEKGNYLEIRKQIQNLDMSSSEDNEQKFKIKSIVIRNINVKMTYKINDVIGEKNYKVDDITIKNFRRNNYVTLKELSAILINKIIISSMDENYKLVADQYRNQLDEQVNDAIDKMKKEASEMVDEFGKSIFGK